jgi:hypothetical protein
MDGAEILKIQWNDTKLHPWVDISSHWDMQAFEWTMWTGFPISGDSVPQLATVALIMFINQSPSPLLSWVSSSLGVFPSVSNTRMNMPYANLPFYLSRYNFEVISLSGGFIFQFSICAIIVSQHSWLSPYPK